MMNRSSQTGGTPPIAAVRREGGQYSAIFVQPGSPWTLLHSSEFDDPALFVQECQRLRVSRIVRGHRSDR